MGGYPQRNHDFDNPAQSQNHWHDVPQQQRGDRSQSAVNKSVFVTVSSLANKELRAHTNLGAHSRRTANFLLTLVLQVLRRLQRPQILDPWSMSRVGRCAVTVITQSNRSYNIPLMRSFMDSGPERVSVVMKRRARGKHTYIYINTYAHIIGICIYMCIHLQCMYVNILDIYVYACTSTVSTST